MSTMMVPARERVTTLRGLLEKSKPQIAMALPKHLSADRILRVAMTSVQRNPRLLECDPVTVVGAVIQAAQLGLEPDGVLGHAYLIPRRNRRKGTVECQFQAGYRGLVALARRSGEITSVEARVVYERDQFSYAFGLTPRLEHVPYQGEGDPGLCTYVYAIIRLKSGEAQWDVMSRARIEAHRERYSQATDDSAWVTAWEEMARKTVLLRVLKLAPLSVEVERVVAVEEHVAAGLPTDLDVVVAAEQTAPEVEPARPSKLDALAEKIGGENGHAAEPVAVVAEAVAEEPVPPAMQDTGEAALLGARLDAAYEKAGITPLEWSALCREHAGVEPEGLATADAAGLSDLLKAVEARGRKGRK